MRLAILAALVALAFLAGGWALPVVILGVVVMIFLHEFGHFLAAKFGGMKVTEFFIGFGPRIWSFRRGETEYGLKAIPAGAYVKIIGMNNLDEVAPEDEDRTYRSKSYPKRMLVAVAGSAMHFAQALVLLFVLYAVIGIPGGSLTETKQWTVGEVVTGSAADAAGLQPGDRIVSVDGTEVATFGDFSDDIAAHPGDAIDAHRRAGRPDAQLPATIGVSPRDTSRGLLGIRVEPTTTTTGPITAVTSSFSDFADQSTATLGFLGDFFTPSGISDFAGDVANGSGDPNQTVDAPSSGSGSAQVSDSPDEGRIISIVGAVRIGANLTEIGDARLPPVLRRHQHHHRHLQPAAAAAPRRRPRRGGDLRADPRVRPPRAASATTSTSPG